MCIYQKLESHFSKTLKCELYAPSNLEAKVYKLENMQFFISYSSRFLSFI